MEYERTRFGRFMYSLVSRCGYCLVRHQRLAKFLSLTWGILGLLIGLIEMLIVLILPKKKKFGNFNGFPYVMFGDNWGGLSGMLWFFVADGMGDEWTKHVKEHECGHCFQNAILGPFMPFLVMIPSVIRYWMKTKKPYDSAWWEGTASDIGSYYRIYRDWQESLSDL